MLKVVEFMENAPSHQKLNFMYVMDAICRQSIKKHGRDDVYCREFLRYFDRVSQALCDCQSANIVSHIHRQIETTKYLLLFYQGICEEAVRDMGEGQCLPHG